MISSVKLQRYTKLRQIAAPFWDTAQSMLNRIGSLVDNTHILCNGYPDPKKALIVMFSSDRGLCGRYNSNAIRKAMQLFDTLSSQNRDCQFSFIGSKGHAFFKRRKLSIEKLYEGTSHPDYATATRIASELFDEYLKGNAHEIWLVYTKKVALLEETYSEQLLPFNKIGSSEPGNQSVLMEESGTELLKNYGLTALKAIIYKALLEAAVSEHNARMSAMDTATSNCDQMIQRYIKLRNRARQTAITTELSEIVSGKEAIDN